METLCSVLYKLSLMSHQYMYNENALMHLPQEGTINMHICVEFGMALNGMTLLPSFMAF